MARVKAPIILAAMVAAVAVFVRAFRKPVVVEGMAAPREAGGTDADLDLLFDQVAALRALGQDAVRSQRSGVVYDFSIRWGTFLSGRLHRLRHYAETGQLSASQRERYERLLAELDDVHPLVERFDLAVPVTGPR